ncbi:MAG TPA: GSCFA domain-containing protein [Melioribacteraceae bacterium]|nr:GSCFA domain-containing protein [Melioribacteraceae bacterium]
MFNFRTEIDLQKYDFSITHNHIIFTIGSCFSDNIGDYLEKYKFNVCKNPFGVLYNPASILNTLKLAAENRKITKEDLISNQDEYHSFYHHSDFSSHNLETVLLNINNLNREIFKLLPKLDVVIITYGTSIVYEYKENLKVVSNCHKIPASKFNKFMLSLKDIDGYIKETIELLRSFNKNIKIVFTISPVRHWKDGAIDNNVSKSKLIVGINDNLGENIYYFPAYEIVMDDLRDYRFYKKDLYHPNELAVEYIWEKFKVAFFNEETLALNNQIEYILNALNHKPRNPNSPKHLQFIESINYKINELLLKHPYLNF